MIRSAVSPFRRAMAAKNAALRWDTIRASRQGQPSWRQPRVAVVETVGAAVTREAGFSWSGWNMAATPCRRRRTVRRSTVATMDRERRPTASTASANRHGRLSVGRHRREATAEGLEVELDRAADLRRGQALEGPEHERQADLDPPGEGRRVAVVGRQPRLDVGRRALLVAAADGEAGYPARARPRSPRSSPRGRPRTGRSAAGSPPGAAEPSTTVTSRMPDAISHSGQRSTSTSASKTSAAGRSIRIWTSWRIAISRRPGRVDRPEAVRRPAAEALRRRAVLEDQVRRRRGCGRRRSSRSATASNVRSPSSTVTRGSASRLRAQAASGSVAATRIAPSASSMKPTSTARGAPLRRPIVVSRATTPRRASAESSGRVSGSVVVGDRRRRSPRPGTPRSRAGRSGRRVRTARPSPGRRIGRRRRQVGDAAGEGVGHRHDAETGADRRRRRGCTGSPSAGRRSCPWFA